MYTDSCWEYVGFLKKLGFERIGQGAYCSAYKKPEGNIVVKVSGTGETTSTYSGYLEDGFEKYVNFLKEEKSPHGLKVHSFRRFNQGLENEFYVSVAEYVPHNCWSLNYEYENGFWELDDQVTQLRHLVWRLQGDGDERVFVLPTTLIDFVRKISDRFTSWVFDLHRDNIRWRGDTLVLIDPIVLEEYM